MAEAALEVLTVSGLGGGTTVALEDDPGVLGRCSWAHSATLKSFGFAHVETVASRSAGGNVARTRFGVGVCRNTVALEVAHPLLVDLGILEA